LYQKGDIQSIKSRENSGDSLLLLTTLTLLTSFEGQQEVGTANHFPPASEGEDSLLLFCRTVGSCPSQIASFPAFEGIFCRYVAIVMIICI
jgi:hypothetical protein